MDKINRPCSFGRIFKENAAFFIPFALLWVASFIFLLTVGKSGSQLLLNACHTDFWDHFFTYFTYVGDSAMFFSALFIGLLFSYRFSFYTAAMGLAMIILVYILKQSFDAPRPSVVLADLIASGELPTVPFVNLHVTNSFPSGHTTTAFSLFLMIAMFMKNNFVKFLCLLACLTAAYSRIYLSQHFLEDILAGQILGATMAVLTYYILQNNQKVQSWDWIHKGLLRRSKAA